MQSDKELMQQALDALERYSGVDQRACDAEEALRERLAQPEVGPVAWWHDRGDVVDLNVSGHGTPLYFVPPQREWQGLTDDEVNEAAHKCVKSGQSVNAAIRAIEAKLKEKNAL